MGSSLGSKGGAGPCGKAGSESKCSELPQGWNTVNEDLVLPTVTVGSCTQASHEQVLLGYRASNRRSSTNTQLIIKQDRGNTSQSLTLVFLFVYLSIIRAKEYSNYFQLGGNRRLHKGSVIYIF